MHLRTLFAASLCSLSVVCPLSAQLPPRPPVAPASQPAPPPKPLKDEDTAKLLAQITEMSKKLDEDKFGHNAKLIRDLREAGTSGEKAFALWLDAIKEVDYAQKNRTASEFADWKRNQTKDADRERDAGLQLHVQWLTVVLMYSNARTDTAKSEAIVLAGAFVDTVVDRMQKNEGKLGRQAYEDVLNGVIAKYLKLESSLTKAENTAFVPADVDGIYEHMILPFYREAGNASALMGSWTKRIEQQTALAASHKSAAAKEKFTAEKLPDLRWGQARDMFKLGQEETASQQMLAILRASMAHKNASRWMDEMIALLKKEEMPEPSKVSPSTPAPETPAPTGGGPARQPGKGPFPGGKFPGGGGGGKGR